MNTINALSIFDLIIVGGVNSLTSYRFRSHNTLAGTVPSFEINSCVGKGRRPNILLMVIFETSD